MKTMMAHKSPESLGLCAKTDEDIITSAAPPPPPPPPLLRGESLFLAGKDCVWSGN